jgi:hypothetical protein
MVPIRADATVKPSSPSLSAKTRRRSSVVPEMTAVSKPKSSPPRAAIQDERRSAVFIAVLLKTPITLTARPSKLS